LNKLLSDMLIETLVANPSELYFGQEVLYCDIQRLYYELNDMYIPYPNIEEDMEFIKVLIVNKKLEENFSSLVTELISSVGTLETNI
jgi:hypothetical protein